MGGACVSHVGVVAGTTASRSTHVISMDHNILHFGSKYLIHVLYTRTYFFRIFLLKIFLAPNLLSQNIILPLVDVAMAHDS